MDSSKSSSKILQIEADSKKYAFVTRQFIFKSAECIYQERCPKIVSDFVSDDNIWFSLDIPKSNQLRQTLAPNRLYGFARIDVMLSDPNELLERWYIIHSPHKHTDSIPMSTQNRKELKVYVYRHYSSILRSLYSLLNALPAKTLSIQLKHMPITKRKIKAEIFQFSELPISIMTDMDDFEVATLRFGPVITPIGRSQIICHHRVDIIPLIPRPIRTAPHINVSRPFTSTSQIPQMSAYGSMRSSMASLTYGKNMTYESFRDFVENPDFYPEEHSSLQRPNQEEDFNIEQLIKEMQSHQFPDTMPDSTYARFSQIQKILQLNPDLKKIKERKAIIRT